MIRTLSGAVLGIGIAVVTMIVAEAIGNRLFGFPIGPGQALPVTDQALPTGVQVAVVAGWFLGTLLGSTAAVWASRVRITAWIVAAAILIGVVARVLMSATPPLMIAAGIVLPLLAAWLGQRAGLRWKASPELTPRD